MLDVVWLIPAFPLAGFLLILLFGRRLGEPGAGYVATTAVLGSFVVGGVFLVSVVVRRPMVERLALDFWPLTPEMLANPAVDRLLPSRPSRPASRRRAGGASRSSRLSGGRHPRTDVSRHPGSPSFAPRAPHRTPDRRRENPHDMERRE